MMKRFTRRTYYFVACLLLVVGALVCQTSYSPAPARAQEVPPAEEDGKDHKAKKKNCHKAAALSFATCIQTANNDETREMCQASFDKSRDYCNSLP
jgi:hypothetical protein